MRLPSPPRIFGLRCGALVGMAVLLSAEEVTFRFAPPDGFTESVLIRRGRTVTRGETVQKDVSETRFRWTAHKGETGYRVERHILSNSLKRDGHTVASPMIDAMAGVELIYSIDAEGKASGIEGYDGILENLKSKFPPQLMQSFGPLFSSESLRKGDLAEWKDRVEQFAGRTVRIGEAWTSQETVPLPGGGRIQAHSATLFAGWTECPGGPCVRIRFFYDSDPTKLVERVNQVADGALKEPPAASPDSSKASLKGEGERLVNPRILRIASEKTTRTLYAEVPARGGTASGSVKVVETNEYIVNPD